MTNGFFEWMEKHSGHKTECGPRVRLFAFEDEPEQFGTILDWGNYDVNNPNEMYVIVLDDQYRVDEYDDGLREASADQFEVISES